jgi:hypothetical protein
MLSPNVNRLLLLLRMVLLVTLVSASDVLNSHCAANHRRKHCGGRMARTAGERVRTRGRAGQ